jgi:prepilin-type processing-associated H-X9-DG protein
MPFLFSCPHCNAQTEVEEQFAGQCGPCFSCGKTVTVPYSASVAYGPARTAARGSGSTTGVLLVLVLAGVLGGVAVIGILFALLIPAASSARTAATRNACMNNLKQISLAMEMYQQKNGSYPPAYIADENGKPMHSWRVLLLPYMGYDWLYEQYDLSQPWDSPVNIGLSFQMPSVYACPDDPDAQIQYETSYMVVVGRGTMFPGDKCTTPANITDGLSNTIMVVEVPESGVSWMEPKDLDARQITFQINNASGNEIGSHHTGGANVLMADGKTKFMRDTLPAQYVESLTTASGGEAVTSKVLDDY